MRRLIRGDEAPRARQLEEQKARRPAAKGERPQPDRTEQECLLERKARETLQRASEREQSPKGAQFHSNGGIIYVTNLRRTQFKTDIIYRARTRHYKMQKSVTTRTGIISTRICFGNYRTTKKTKTILKPRL